MRRFDQWAGRIPIARGEDMQLKTTDSTRFAGTSEAANRVSGRTISANGSRYLL
jgi:hypothetical protein